MNTFSIDIDAPPARVFRWIYDRDLNKQWLPNLVEAEVRNWLKPNAPETQLQLTTR